MAEKTVDETAGPTAEAAERAADPLEQAWRCGVRCRPVAWQCAGCTAALLLAALGWGIARGAGSAAAQVIWFGLGLMAAYAVSVATGAVVMAAASAEGAGERFRAAPFLARAIVPCLVVAGSCLAAVVAVSIFFHSVLILLASTGRMLGEIIFALAVVPMYLVAFLELLLLLGGLYVFPPALVDSSPGARGAVQRFLDALVACRLSDLCLRLRALVAAALIALPVLIALALCDVYLVGMSMQAGVCPWAMASGSVLVDALLVVSGIVILAAALAVPAAYLNAACLMVHRSARS